MTRPRDGEEYPPIGDYALIGDCHSSALVSRDGAIDWACLSRFDGGAAFARILDWDKGGTFSLTPRGRYRAERRYLPGTNVLETTFVTPRGSARILDCFTMRSGGRHKPHRQLLRVVEGMSGKVWFDVLVQPRFDYGALRPWLRFHPGKNVFSAVGGSDAFVLSSDAELEIERQDASLVGEIVVGKRHRCRFSLVSREPHELHLERTPSRVLDDRLRATVKWWRAWTKKGKRAPEYGDAVERSALVLKLLTNAPTGAIIAAPTTSLPEVIGGSRNWDYRFSWVRDSTPTLAALLNVGHREVATGFKSFIERATAGSANDLQIMYGCYGERRLPEVKLEHLDGYRGSRPVRMGNAAAKQAQLDVYGELLQAAHLWRRHGHPIDDDAWRFLRSLVEGACARWREKDRGLWEMRGAPRHFVHSKVMCWVAVHRGIETAVDGGLPCDLERWRSVRNELRETIEREGIDRRRGCFVQSFGSRELDASLLLLPIVGFIEASDPRMKKTVDAIREDLSQDGLIRRYRPEKVGDGIEGTEGVFLLASFWLVDVLAMQGQLRPAKQLFRRLLGMGNDLGLYSEEYDVERKQLLGNFPQAFTHMALINAAAQLRRAEESGDHRQPIADRVHTKP